MDGEVRLREEIVSRAAVEALYDLPFAGSFV